MKKIIIVSNVSDASFAISVAHYARQVEDILDLVSLKSFENTEFCPRFIHNEATEENIGRQLEGKTVYIISTSSPHYTRNELATRNFLIASAAKENGADSVILIEPDLFYSAQDRGVQRKNHPQVTDFKSLKKFSGQPCSAFLYAKLLKASGVDMVMTVHNHKPDVMAQIYEDIFDSSSFDDLPRFMNLDISHIVANYILTSGLANLEDSGKHIGFVAPDNGAVDFVNRVREFTNLHQSNLINMDKTRYGQRDVEISASNDIQELQGQDVFILDDMTRTGGTIAAGINLLAEEAKPANLFFYCTHTYISSEGRSNLDSQGLNQFITTNTIPNILNRDDQGRLRKKTAVLKIEKWIADAIIQCIEHKQDPQRIYGQQNVINARNLYDVDISSKNPRRKNLQSLQYELL